MLLPLIPRSLTPSSVGGRQNFDHRHIHLRFLFLENEDFYSPIPIPRLIQHKTPRVDTFFELLFIDFPCSSMQFLTSSQVRRIITLTR